MDPLFDQVSDHVYLAGRDLAVEAGWAASEWLLWWSIEDNRVPVVSLAVARIHEIGLTANRVATCWFEAKIAIKRHLHPILQAKKPSAGTCREVVRCVGEVKP